MQRYLITGAAGHLGNTIVRMLVERGEAVRGLVLPDEKDEVYLPKGMEICHGNVLDAASLSNFFRNSAGDAHIVIHCAGIVSIASGRDHRVYDVNVRGTQNVLDRCLRAGVKKLVYVSSVHAIPEPEDGGVIREIADFDPRKVVGTYAKTKAEATAAVLACAREGLNASVVHPSGIFGPNDYGTGHLTQLLIDYWKGHLTAGISGGYDFVDVRDVAQGILACCTYGSAGGCYILSGHFCQIREVLEAFHRVTGKRRIRTYLPMWFAKGTAPLAEMYYKILRQKPLYTPLSLYTLTSNGHFSHEKAGRELGYTVRPMEESISDMVGWLKSMGRIS